jgi:DNA-binding transcriptional ArsR family regulator
MVNNHGRYLDRTFGTLSHPTRRAIVARLAQGSAAAGVLAQPFGVSLPAISRHLRLLEEADLIVRERRGRQHVFTLQPVPLRDAATWLESYRHFWEVRLDRLASHVEENP